MFSISKISKNNYFVGSLITSAIGAATLLFADFAWWDASNYYLGIREYGWLDVSFDNLLVAPFLIVAAGLLIFIAYESYLGLNKQLRPEMLRYTFLASLGSIGTQAFIAIVFIIIVTLEDIWWGFDLGFFGGIIGAGLSSVLIYLAMKE
ncbi:MAG: hypothetical protein ACTSW1_18670 [Candidatus Hodarchaeales archaeon]